MTPTVVTSRPARGAQPTEQFLQQVWQYQRISRGTLRTTDGRRLAVLHPGFINHEAGPNFRRAFIQIGRVVPIECDLEIDLVSKGWRQRASFSIDTSGDDDGRWREENDAATFVCKKALQAPKAP